MSGITGIYLLDGSALHSSELAAMVDSLAHRGPDGLGSWSEESVGVGHRMLWTTPESLNEKLPLQNRTGDLVLTADARIDNREELAAALDIGQRLHAISDSELILRAYEKWDEHCPEKLLGDFAFAVWDRRKKAVFCARDHMGIKPFYYYKSKRAFLFGSEIKALFAFPEVPRELNEMMVGNYLTTTFQDTSATFYKDILRLPPGHCMTISTETLHVRCYWSLDPSYELHFSSDEAYAEALREIFAEAVRCRLRSAFPLGSELSGGLDSSSVACMAKTLLPSGMSRLHTFSATFDEVPESDERRFINAVLAQDGFNPHFVPCDGLNPLGNIERLFWQLDEPFWAPSMFMYSALYSAARGAGVRILLGGDDGDNAIGYGIDYIPALTRAGRWIAAAREISGLARHFNRSRWRILKTYALRPLIPEPVLRFREFFKGGREGEQADLMNPELASNIGPPGNHNDNRLSRLASKRALLEQWCNLTDGVASYGCEMFDKAAAGFSIELRYPFLDRRLLEFCLAVPASQKLYRGWTRMIMRRAMKGVLPDEIRWRGGKATLTPNFNRALLLFAKEILDDVILKTPGTLETYVDMSALRNTYEQYLSSDGKTAYYDLWSAVTLALWLRYSEATNASANENLCGLKMV